MLFCATAFSQNGAYRQKTSIVTASPLLIDSLSIIPASLEIRIENKFIKEHEYQLNVLNNTITFDEKWIGHVALLKYQVLTWNWKQDIYLLDTSMITQPLIAPYRFRAEKTGARMGFSETDELQKQGSISRAVVVGNGQNTSVNSDLNLQISGKISDNIYVRANVTDRSIPVQPEGNTQSLQEFDQVFVEVWNDHNKLVVGDFETRSNESYFLAYQKRARGMLFQSNTQDEKKFTSKVGGALSRGKFNRMTLAGVEGNQGPYRLKGADLESFIVVLAGTERVYINGIPLERGLDRDYTIDYNNAEVTFTANRLITKDSLSLIHI